MFLTFKVLLQLDADYDGAADG